MLCTLLFLKVMSTLRHQTFDKFMGQLGKTWIRKYATEGRFLIVFCSNPLKCTSFLLVTNKYVHLDLSLADVIELNAKFVYVS